MVREQTLVIEEALKKGIAKNDSDTRDLDYLYDSNGLISTQNGLEKIRELDGANMFLKNSAQLLAQPDFDVSPTNWTLNTGWSWNSSTEALDHASGASNGTLASETAYTVLDERLYLIKIQVSGFPSDNAIRSVGTGSGANDQYFIRPVFGGTGVYQGPKIIRDGTFYIVTVSETSGGTTNFSLLAHPYATLSVQSVGLWTLLQTENAWHPTGIVKSNLYDLFVTQGVMFELQKESDGTWTTRDITPYDAYNPDSTTTYLGSVARYKLTDFKNALFITRGVSFIMYLPSEGQRFMVSKTTAPGDCLNYNNRLILGGLIGDPNQLTYDIDEYFESSTDWTLDPGWTIASDKLSGSVTGGSISANYTGYTTAVGSTYKVEFDVLATSNLTGGFTNYLAVLLETPHTITNEEAAIDEPGHYVLYFTVAGTGITPVLSLVANSGTATIEIANLKINRVGWFGTDRWINLFNLWKEYSPVDVMTSELQYFSYNWVMWSNLGGGDVFWPFTEEMALLGMPDTTRFDLLKSHFEDSIKAQQIGFLEMPFKGRVEGLYKVGEFILVFGDDGIAVMTPVDKAEGFGFVARKIINSGINCNLSFAGTDQFCYFVDTTGTMWVFTADGALQNLGYSNVLDRGTSVFWNLFYDETIESLYLNPSDTSTNYVLNKNGLSKYPLRMTSFIRRDGQFYAFPQYTGWYTDTTYAATINPLDGSWEFTTNEIDFGVRAIKTIHSVQIDASFMEHMRVTIEYRYDPASAWSEADEVLVNDTGVAVSIVSGVDFRIKVAGYTVSGGNNPVVRRLDVKWHLSDKRNVRGLINA